MACTTPTTSTNTKEIVAEIHPYLRVFNDGTVERLQQAPIVPALLDDPQTGVSSKDILISHHPAISARLYIPKLTRSSDQLQVPILVYFHGGAFVCESAFSKLYHDHFSTFVPQANAIVVSVEYRQAPEHPLPACYHDCWAALQWVASHSAENPTNAEPWLINHGDLNRVFIGGDSAGGNIVHNIAMRAGTVALPCDVKISGAFLCHPFFCGSQPVGSEPVTRPKQEEEVSKLFWRLVYPSASGGIDKPMLNPVGPGAPSLSGLGCSRILMCVAGKDRLRDRGILYYESVKKSGWQGKLELFEDEDEGHDYHIFRPRTQNANRLIKRLASFLQE